MKLAFVYAPVTDLEHGPAFYRDTLGWAEAWRDGVVAGVADPAGNVLYVFDQAGGEA